MTCRRYIKRRIPVYSLNYQTAEEKLNAFKTVTAYNSQAIEDQLFQQKVDRIFGLARKEAYMTGVFWGMSGLTGNLALLCLLGYGQLNTAGVPKTHPRWNTCVSIGDLGRRSVLALDV